jgi:hypothetical protein
MVCPQCCSPNVLTLSTARTNPAIVTGECAVCDTKFAVELVPENEPVIVRRVGDLRPKLSRRQATGRLRRGTTVH